MFALMVTFRLKTGMAELFDELMQETTAAISTTEPGTLAYVVHSANDDDLTRVFYELYEDEAALAVHEAQPATASFLRKREDLLESFSVLRLHPLMGKGPGFQSG
jgi:quinol monooxygenase YgiN